MTANQLPGDVLDSLLVALGGFATAAVPLGPLTTYRVGGPAAVLAAPRSVDDLRLVAAAAQRHAVPMLVVGRGSNLLVADEGFAGIAVSLVDLADAIEISGDDVVAGGAAALPVVARRSAAAGLTGFEWAVGVPGSIGGAVRMNAGGHGSDMASVLESATVFDLVSGRLDELPAGDLGFRFRGSDLTDRHVVVAARIALRPGDVATSEAAIADIVRWRREHQPGGQNAGSVFVNPVPGQVAAAQLVEHAGLRGHRRGGAEVSPKHANFVQASESGSARDVQALMEYVRRCVADETGFLLRSEVRQVGFSRSEAT